MAHLFLYFNWIGQMPVLAEQRAALLRYVSLLLYKTDRARRAFGGVMTHLALATPLIWGNCNI